MGHIFKILPRAPATEIGSKKLGFVAWFPAIPFGPGFLLVPKYSFDTTSVLCQLLIVIPDFQDDGLLPPGVHWSVWSEIESRFGTNKHRQRLLGGLQRGIYFLSLAGCTQLFIDGSFVTVKEFPADYDVCWAVEGVDLKTLRAHEPALLSFANSRALQKAKLLGEYFPTGLAAETAPPFRTFLEFFQRDKATGLEKGIVGYRVEIKHDH